MGRLWLGGALALLLSSSSAAQDTAPTPVPDNDHHGPYVAAGKSGPARFVGPLYAAFDKDRAMRLLPLFKDFSVECTKLREAEELDALPGLPLAL